MKKKSLGIALSAALIAATTPVIAYEECPFSGFYGGVQLGGNFLSGRETVGTSGSTAIGVPVVSLESINTFSKRAVRRNSFAGEIFAGYGCDIWDQVYLGAEIFVKGARATATNVDDANSAILTAPATTLSQDIATQVRTRLRPWEFGIDFRPGFLLCDDALLYGRVGYSYNRASIRTATTYSSSLTVAGVTTAFPTNSVIVDSHRHTGALRLGLGLEQELCDNLTLRTDYTYSRYRKVNTSGSNALLSALVIPGAAPVPISSTVSNNTTSRLISHAFMIGLSYYW